MFPLTSHYLSAVEDRIAREVIPNIDAWVEATGGGGDVDLARAARSLQWCLDQLYRRLGALQRPARVIDRHGWSQQECRSSATTTNDLSHTPAFRSGIPGHPVRASQPSNSAVARLATNRAGDFAPLSDHSRDLLHDVAVHRQITATGRGVPKGHQVLPNQQNFQGPDESTIQPSPCQDGVGACDRMPLPGSAAFPFPHHSFPDMGATCADTSLGCTEVSLTTCPLNWLENDLPLSPHRDNRNRSVPNSTQPPEMEEPSFLTAKDVISAPAERQAVVGNKCYARQRTSNCSMPTRANGARIGHDFGMMRTRSTTLAARRSGRTPIEIDSSSESEATSESSLSVDQDMTLTGEDPSLLRLVEKANACLNFPEGTLRRFLPGDWLNDVNVIETVRMLVPETAEPLIAEYAIQNLPEGGLARPYTPTEAQNILLKHRKDSTHLLIAYNVPNGTLNYTKRDHKNHWVLIIVSVLTRKIHIFGAEAGLQDQAKALANNIGMFVNNHRRSSDDHRPPLKWPKPILKPLYPFEITPDTYNCGIAVISHAEAFFHPEKAVNVEENTTSSELSQQLNRKRFEYLRLFIDRYKALHTTKKLYDKIAQQTSITPAKRQVLDHPLTSRPQKSAKRSPQWLLSYSAPLLSSEPRLSKSELWEKCIMTCADANGFNAGGLVQAFRNAPECAFEIVARVLQCFCDVASPKRLIMLKQLLNQRRTDPLLEEATSTSSDEENLWQLHSLIRKFATIDQPILIFQSLFCLLCYYKCHKFAVSSRQKELDFGRANHVRERNRKRGRDRSQTAPDQDLSRPALTADQQVRASLVARLQEARVSPEEAHAQITKNLRYGKRLQLLLDGRNPLWLMLMLVQPDGSSVLLGDKTPPALNLRNFSPPTDCRKLSEPISTDELLGLTEKLAAWFGENLFIARPELRDIDLSSVDIFGNIRSPIWLSATSDEDIYGTAPKDSAKLLQKIVDGEN